MDFFIKIILKKAEIVLFLLRMRKGRSFRVEFVFVHVPTRVQEAEFREQGAIVFI